MLITAPTIASPLLATQQTSCLFYQLKCCQNRCACVLSNIRRPSQNSPNINLCLVELLDIHCYLIYHCPYTLSLLIHVVICASSVFNKLWTIHHLDSSSTPTVNFVDVADFDTVPRATTVQCVVSTLFLSTYPNF